LRDFPDAFLGRYLPRLLSARPAACRHPRGHSAVPALRPHGLALLLLFPAYLARESTVLVALLDFCRLAAHPAPLRRDWGSGDVVRRPGQPALRPIGPRQRPRPGRRVYILGKLFWNFFKNVLGLPCGAIRCRSAAHLGHGPAARLPSRRHSTYRSVPALPLGTCTPLLAWFGIFGIGPALALALWRRMVSPAPSPAGSGAGPIWSFLSYPAEPPVLSPAWSSSSASASSTESSAS
jgi:hypothetical protein